MRIKLSDHFTYKKLLRFTFPSIVMMIFTSIYGVVDGYFVSNYAGKTPFAAVNFIYPFIMILGAFGFMLGTGGSALIAKTLGEGKQEKARKLFSMFVYISIGLGVAVALLGIIFIRPVASMLGAEGEMLEYCVIYGRIILAVLPFFMLQLEFQSFFVTAEKPLLGLLVTVVSGVTNMVMDAVLVILLPQELKLVGAAIATALSQFVGGVIPLVYFSRKNAGILRFVKPEFDGKALLKACTNGSSELLSNISMSIVSMLYNFQLLKYAGEDGVAAYGVLMYVNFVFLSAYIGYSVGVAPIIGYHYGAKNTVELKGLLRKSFVIIGVCSVLMMLLAFLTAKPLSVFFVGYDKALTELTLRGFTIFSLSFLFSGVAIFGSGFFTALNDGLVSAIISFMRTLVLQVVCVLTLPLIFDIDGIWVSGVVAEAVAAALTLILLLAKRKKYQY
ncbi:MAG: MATE family efflux transporter [Clostridia bacterium]|nr:MATE family efflux transporter [Clostridia bacterium]